MVLTEKPHAGGYILREPSDNLARENAVLNAAQNLSAGTVLGRLLAIGAATFVGTVGTRGTVTVGAGVGPHTQIGTYTLKCVTASSNAGTFQLRAPDGSIVPFDTATVITVAGGAFTSDHLDITIADGATDFTVGDTYTIAVSGGDYEILDPAEDDGTQIAAAILYAGVDATDGDVPCVVTVRDTAVIGAELVWPDAITDAQKATAVAQLAKANIQIR